MRMVLSTDGKGMDMYDNSQTPEIFFEWSEDEWTTPGGDLLGIMAVRKLMKKETVLVGLGRENNWDTKKTSGAIFGWVESVAMDWAAFRLIGSREVNATLGAVQNGGLASEMDEE